MHPKRFIGKLILIILLVAPAVTWAALPLITDDTGTQGKGKFQVEASGAWSTQQTTENVQERREINSIADFTLTAGISEAVDLAVDVPYIWSNINAEDHITKNEGFADLIVAAKWRFYSKKKVSIAIKPGILLPTGNEDKGLGTGNVGYLVTLISTVQLEPWEFDLNLAYYDLENRVDERNNIWFTSLAAHFKIAEAWAIVGEAGASRNAEKDDGTDPAFAQIGLIYSPKEFLDLSAGLLMGLNSAEVDEAIRLGLTVRF
jgi:hypothetical protein